MKQEVLVVAPHPDDETFGCGGTIKWLTKDGNHVDVAFMTRGELGSELEGHANRQALEQVAQERTREAEEACGILGVRRLVFLDGKDGQLSGQPFLKDALAELLRTKYK